MKWWFHRHLWSEVDRTFMEESTYSPPILGSKLLIENAPITLITYQCECGNYKQQRLAGHVNAPQKG